MFVGLLILMQCKISNDKEGRKLYFNAIEDDSDSNKGQMRRIWGKILRQMPM